MKRWLTAALATLLFAAGCGEHPVEPDPDGCQADYECSGDQVCRQGICTVTDTEPRTMGFRLEPPPGSNYPPQSVPFRDLRPDRAIQIGLEPGVRVAGALSWIGEGEGGPGAGRLKFKQLGGDGFTGETTVDDNQYEIFVPAGRYDVRFFPTDTERPTYAWTDIEIELDTDPRLQMVEGLVSFTGTLSRTDSVTGESPFVTGARVFATSRETGVTSTVATTDESGVFSLSVASDSGTYDLHVAPPDPNTFEQGDFADYIPEATYEKAFSVEANTWTNLLSDGGADLLSVSLGEYGYASLQFAVRLIAAGLDDVDWSGTTVTLTTEAGAGTLTVRQRLEQDGEFELPLVQGVYAVEVKTPPNLPVASTRLTDIDLDNTEEVAIDVDLRTHVEGEVVGAEDLPLPNAQVSFEPVDDDPLVESASVVTNRAGRYDVWLDDVDYRVTVTPADPNLPRRVFEASPGEIPASVGVSEPSLVWGSVVGTPADAENADAWPTLPDVRVRVLERSSDGTVVIGEGQTNDDGEFQIVIPAR